MSTTIQIGTGIGSGPPPACVSYGLRDGGDQHARRLLGRYRLGLALFVAAVVMLFVGFSSAYVVRRGIPLYAPELASYSTSWEPLQAPLTLLLVNTAVLLAASFIMECARRGARAGFEQGSMARSASLFISLSSFLVVLFFAGQGLAWRELRMHDVLLSTGAHSAFFYLLTGTHAFHAVLGLAAMTWISLRARHWSISRRYITTDLVAWYLHSMTALWVYLLLFLYFA